MSAERETHFRGYAKLLYEDIYWMFNNLFIEEADMGPGEQKAEQTRQGIQSYLSERAYDLVYHSQQFMPGVEHVPDLTEWSEIPE